MFCRILDVESEDISGRILAAVLRIDQALSLAKLSYMRDIYFWYTGKRLVRK